MTAEERIAEALRLLHTLDGWHGQFPEPRWTVTLAMEVLAGAHPEEGAR